MMDLTPRYDAKADILSVKLREGKIADENLLENDVLISLDKNGEPVSPEIWGASKRGLYQTPVDLANEKRDLIDTLLNRPTVTSTIK